ncbi:MAG: ABC transporter substrate-binding protein [Thermoleophilaceae bacterium]|jgi:branched-chain amino acid transport system substrate-binding protein
MTRSKGISRHLLSTIVCAGLVVGVAACGSDNKSSSGTASGSGTTAAAKAKVTGGQSLACKNGAITVGIAKAKSGGSSFFDIAGTRGAKIAFDQINADGGIKGCKIKVIEGDTKSDPAVAAQVARSLLDKGAQILLVPDDFDLGIAAARVGQKAGVLTLSTAASSTEFAKAVGDKFFNAGPTTAQLGTAQAKFALDKGWKTTYMVVDPGLAYFTEQVTAYKNVYGQGGGKIAGTDKVDSLSGKSDYSSTVSKIKAMSPAPQVIDAQMIFPPIGSFVKQLRSAGIDTPVLGNVTLQTRELPKLVGKAGSNNVYYAAQVYFEGANQDPKSDPAMDKFATEYQAKFGGFPEQANGPGSYQALMAINKALQQKDVTDAASAAAAIKAQKNVAVPGGTLVRWENGHAIWNITIDGLSNGQFKQFQVVKAD